MLPPCGDGLRHILSDGPDAAGANLGESDRAQHCLTHVRERFLEHALAQDIAALPMRDGSRDARRMSWDNVGVYSRVLVTVMPFTTALQLPNLEWQEAMTIYLGLPSPACAAHRLVGLRVPTTGDRSVTLDAHGFALSRLQMRGDHHC